MSCGKRAEQELLNKALGLIAISTVDRALYNDLSFESVKNEAMEIAKYMLKNDKKTQKQIATVAKCKLEEYLG